MSGGTTNVTGRRSPATKRKETRRSLVPPLPLRERRGVVVAIDHADLEAPHSCDALSIV
jgi:hypothetical protein